MFCSFVFRDSFQHFIQQGLLQLEHCTLTDGLSYLVQLSFIHWRRSGVSNRISTQRAQSPGHSGHPCAALPLAPLPN